MHDVAVIAFHIALGFAIGGLIGSLHQWLTDRAPSFQDTGETLTQKLWALALIVLGGPVIIMRNAMRGRRIEGRPFAWIVLSSILASSWSFCSGVSMLQLAVAIRTGFAA